jgi:hypothetical protein
MVLAAVPGRAAEPAAEARDISEKLYEDAIRLRNRGRFQEACAKFRESFAARESPGTLLNIASCQEAEGDLVGALESIEAALVRAEQEPDEHKRGSWLLGGRRDLAALAPRIATLTVRSAAAVPPAAMLDGKPFLKWDTALRLNPGSHQLEAAAPRRRPFVQSLQLAEGQSETIVIPELEEQGPEVAVAPSPPAPAALPAPAEPPPTSASTLVSYSLLGLGSVFFASGAITGLVASKMASDLERDCPGRVCADGLSQRDRAQTTALVADVLMGTGLVAGAVGVTLLLTGGEEAPPASVSWSCGPRGCGASLSGSF